MTKEKIVATEASVAPGNGTPGTVENGKTLHQELAEMMFYDEAVSSGNMDMPFEQLPEEERKKYLNRSRIVIICLDKMNKMVIPKFDQVAHNLSNRYQIMDIIRTFMENMNKPKGLAETFPIEELAIRIIEGRRV